MIYGDFELSQKILKTDGYNHYINYGTQNYT